MYSYSYIRQRIDTGDVLLVKSRKIVSVLIRMFTAESFNHVAMLITNQSGVWVVEMREGKGFQLMPASQWFEINKKSVIHWGKCPLKSTAVNSHVSLRGNHRCLESRAMQARGEKYSYWTLFAVWWSQLTGRKVKNGLVCSTFIQKVWEQCGYRMGEKAADPADFVEHLIDVNRVTA